MGIISTEIKIRELVKGKKTGYTSGTFDLVHSGHITYLKAAKEICEVLIVGINSDSSVKGYKDSRRPIVGQNERAALIAALPFVDYVFIFDDLNNKRIISELKPSYYIKGGDYKKEQLGSSSIVESYGGEIKLIPFVEGYSTTNIINKILSIYGFQAEQKEKIKKPALFLDRDGTIIEEVPYLHEKEKVKLISGVGEALAKLQKHFHLIVVTNQPGIGMGYFTKEDFFKVNLEMLKQLNKFGVLINKIYFCEHAMSENCSCRKPNTRLLELAANDLLIDLSNSYMIGDKISDVELAKNFNIKSILVNTGYAGKEKESNLTPDHNLDTIAKIVDIIQL